MKHLKNIFLLITISLFGISLTSCNLGQEDCVLQQADFLVHSQEIVNGEDEIVFECRGNSYKIGLRKGGSSFLDMSGSEVVAFGTIVHADNNAIILENLMHAGYDVHLGYSDIKPGQGYYMKCKYSTYDSCGESFTSTIYYNFYFSDFIQRGSYKYFPTKVHYQRVK